MLVMLDGCAVAIKWDPGWVGIFALVVVVVVVVVAIIVVMDPSSPLHIIFPFCPKSYEQGPTMEYQL